MQHTVCEALLGTETLSNDDFELGAQQEDRPRFLLRNKSDSSHKRLVAGFLTRPVTGRPSPSTKKARVIIRPQQKPGGNAVASSSVIGKRLLTDVIAIFKTNNSSKMRSETLISDLCANPKKPWATFCRGGNLNSKQFSALLKEFSICSKDMRFDNRSYKGFQKEWFVTAKRCCRINKTPLAMK